MKIITGSLKGRLFEAPKGNTTHPMGDRVKTALFNTIGDEIVGARVLDAYAGSGALGFEAVSRGAQFVQAIEKDHQVFENLKSNLDKLGIDGRTMHITRANCASWAERNTDMRFDVILADPPYEKLNLSTISLLTELLTPEGLMVLSHSGREAVPTVNSTVVVVDDRMYGDAALSYYRKANPPTTEM